MRTSIWLASFISLLLASAGAHAQSLSWCLDPVTQTSQAPLWRESLITVGSNGTEHILFYADSTTGGRGRVMYTSRGASGAFAPFEIVADSAAHVTSICVSVGGPIYASYANASDQSERVRWRPAPGLPWSDVPGGVFSSGDFWKGGMGGQAGLNSSGRACLAYFFGATEDVRFSEQSASGTWTTTAVETNNRVGKGIRIAQTWDGRPLLAYNDQDLNRIIVAERLSNGTWQVDHSSGALQHPADIDALPNGSVVVRSEDSAPFAVYFRSSGGWTQDTPFPSFGYKSARIVVDAAGTIHAAAWQDGGRLDYLKKSAGGAWQFETVTGGVGSVGVKAADVALKPNGEPVFAITLTDWRVVVASRCGITAFCSPNGTSLTCPCGNYGTAPGGCENASLTGGGLIQWSGNAIVGLDTLQLSATGMPPSTMALLFQGDNSVTGGGFAFGDGVICVAAPMRLDIQAAVVGSASFGSGVPGSAPISIMGNVPAGATRYYQVWYRDNQFFCTQATYNLTSGVIVHW